MNEDPGPDEDRGVQPPDRPRRMTALSPMMKIVADNLTALTKLYNRTNGKESVLEEDMWPKFDGSLATFHSFKDEWQTHARAFTNGLQSGVLCRILKKCIPEKMRERFRYAKEVDDLWERLTEHYEDSEGLLQELIARIKYRKISNDDTEGLDCLLTDIVEAAKVALDQGLWEDLHSEANISMIVKTMPAKCARRWYGIKMGLYRCEIPDRFMVFVEDARKEVRSVLGEE